MKVLEFINHASIKIEYGGLMCVTDPWYISNAFGSWFPDPSPNKDEVFDLIDTDKKMCVVVSHGHDDHIDDWFFRKHLKNKTFFCSKFQTPGLEKRLSNNIQVNTKPIGSGEVFGEFLINQFINPDFTNYDAVITIETPDYLIIHANDNWQKWPDSMLAEIKKVSDRYDESSVFLLIQFGIADSFPVNYRGITDKEALNLIDGRFEQYLKSTEDNMKSLNLNHMYYYANQSLFEYKECNIDGLSMYQLAQNFLLKKSAPHVQLISGMSLHKGHKITKSPTPDVALFRYCLDAFENFINERYKMKCRPGEYIPVRFKTMQDEVADKEINYIATPQVWNRILIGELTLEAIIIGGSGVIVKPDMNMNLRDHHHFVSKTGYIAQYMINEKGLSFYREFAH